MQLKRLSIIVAFLCALAGGANAQLAGSNSHTFTWTAVGNDGKVGTASYYELRYTTTDSTFSNWSAATLVTGLAAPKVAGSAESFNVTGLANGTYWFAIKACDAVPNCSVISNIVKLNFADIVAPAMIIDLK
jgi:hypothetical protein